MTTSQIVILIISSLSLFAYAFCCCKDNDNLDEHPDVYDNEAYTQCQRPYIALKNQCNHTGDKTLVAVSSAVNCETVQTVCDDCDSVLKTVVEC